MRGSLTWFPNFISMGSLRWAPIRFSMGVAAEESLAAVLNQPVGRLSKFM